MSRRPLIVYGCGGLGREVAQAARAGQTYDVTGFCDDYAGRRRNVLGIPVLGGFDALIGRADDASIYVAIGDLIASRLVLERIRAAAPEIDFPNVVHPDATLHPERMTMGIGNYIAAGARISVNVRIGDFNVVNLNAVLAHDVVVGSHCQINPGAILNGWVVISDEAVIGAGAVVMPRTRVNDGAVVGIGAVVGGHVEAGCTVLGNPARVARRPAAGGA